MNPMHHTDQNGRMETRQARRHLSTIAITIALLATAAASPSVGGRGPTDAIAHGTGVVVGDVTYQDETVQLERALLIAPGATLRFIDATLLLDLDPANCPEACVLGSVDLFVAPGGILLFHNTTVTSSIDIDGQPKRWTIQGEGGTIRAYNSVFERGQQIRSELPSPFLSRLKGNDLTDVADGLRWTRGAALDLQDNQFRTSGTSVYLRDVQARVTGNAFGGYGSGAAFMALDIIRSTVGGETNLPSSAYLVTNNSFENRTAGIGYVREAAIHIHSNTFHDVKIAFKLELVGNESSPYPNRVTVRDNTFSGNIQTLLWAKAPENASIVFKDNDILSPVCFVAHDYNQGLGTVWTDARHNWWGSTDGPQLTDGPTCQLAKGHNEVTVDPWATEPVAG